MGSLFLIIQPIKYQMGYICQPNLGCEMIDADKVGLICEKTIVRHSHFIIMCGWLLLLFNIWKRFND